MKRTKYLFVIFIGTLVYVILSINFGQNSIRCYKYMENQRKLLSIRTNDISNINNELSLELTALKNDKAVIAAYARKLDYLQDNEKLVKINGLKLSTNIVYDTGTVLKHTEITFMPEKVCKIISMIISLIMLIVFIMYDITVGNITFHESKKTSIVKGIPVYDIPQIL
ncbi:MAG: septum formation initiator family protein [Treponema sp.]|jgi:cell division protein FtsB|nr:septum formation initiator family protein [Treponema sp.]